MGIKHAFTSAKSDGGDSSLVRPSDWNADHTITGGLGGIGAISTFYGKSTVGASAEAVTTSRFYAKKITLPYEGILSSLEVYVQQTADADLGQIHFAVWDDSSNTPNSLLFSNTSNGERGLVLEDTSTGPRTARWFGSPVGLKLSAGSYWIAFSVESANVQIAYDTGTDIYMLPATAQIGDWGLWTTGTTTRDYSLRANVITTQELPVSKGFIGCALYNSSVSVGNGSYPVHVAFTTEYYDTDGFHSNVTNTSRITVPQGLSGKYLVNVTTAWASNSSGERYTYISYNGTPEQWGLTRIGANGTWDTNYTSTKILDLAATDYIEIGLYQQSGGTRTAYVYVEFVKLDSGKVGQGIGAKIYNSTTQAITNATSTTITFDSEVFDTDGFHSTVSNTGKMIIPQGLGGIYVLAAGGRRSGTWGGGQQFWFNRNGSATIHGAMGAPSTTTDSDISLTTIAQLNALDEIEFRVYRDGGSTGNFGHASAADAQSWFAIMRLDSGGSGSNPTVQKVVRTAGSITTGSTVTTMTELSSALRLSISAEVGDILTIGFSTIGSTGSGELAIDSATIVSGSIQNQVTSGTRGVGHGYLGASVTTQLISGTLSYVVQASDISGGTVTVSPTYINSGTASTIYATSSYALSYWVINHRH